MTTTRKYFEELISLLDRLTRINYDEIGTFLEIKRDLLNVLTRIKNFHLIPLTFTNEFYDLISSDKSASLQNDKIQIINELQFELIECLWVTRLHYGGELEYYLFKIYCTILNLTIDELALLKSIIKTAPDAFFSFPGLDFSNSDQKIEAQRSFSKRIHKRGKSKPAPNKAVFKRIEESLYNGLEKYKDYIFNQYPSIANNFLYYKKRIRVYITESIPSESYEIRIYVYLPINGDNSFTLENNYYDFIPTYGYNLEEVTEKPISFYITGYYYDNDNLKSIADSVFDEVAIHRELKNIFISNASNSELKELVKFLFNSKGIKLFSLGIAEKDTCLTGWKGNEHYVIQIIHQTPSDTTSIKEIVDYILKEELKYIGLNKWRTHLKYTVFSTRTDPSIENLFIEKGITIIYLENLLNEQFEADNSRIISWYIKSVLPSFKVSDEKVENRNRGEEIIERLNKCELGDKCWSDYENIGIEVFDFLFSDQFINYTFDTQVDTQLKNHRRDLVVQNNFKNAPSFWAKIYQDYNAKLITVDFKNYSSQISANKVFNSTKYAKKQTGSVVILFCRKGIDESAFQETIELIRKDVLTIVFDDNEIKDMIREKSIGKDPSYRLDLKSFEIMKKI